MPRGPVLEANRGGRYDQLDTGLLKADGKPVFGDIAKLANFKYLLNLEGHDFWSGRLRSLAVMGSAVFKQACAPAS